MHNEVRVDPLNQIAEVNETNNIEFAGHRRSTTAARRTGAFNELTHHQDRRSARANTVARNAIVTYRSRSATTAPIRRSA